MIIRKAKAEDVLQISEIMVEDWKTAYRGIIDDDFLDAMDVEKRYQIEIRRYDQYMVAAEGQEILGYAWNQLTDDEAADCEIVALYVRWSKRKNGIGRALLQNAMDTFRKAGKRKMIIWCLKENYESRKFYEKMGGIIYKPGSHKWGNREYDMISYLYSLESDPQ